ncbi:MAG TPA: PDZ domain-containing protein, partial [Longimicrobium sp.]|jgi:hypothetical protein|nr:PDZ domain-containing protein [Longimicrobium sp.]
MAPRLAAAYNHADLRSILIAVVGADPPVGISFEIDGASTLPQQKQLMRLSRSGSTVAAALVILLLPTALAAQTTGSTPAASRPPGCRGTNSQTSSLTLTRQGGPPVEFPSYPEVESVQPGSPAERAGMRPRDVVVSQDGRDLVANPPTQPALAGDTVVFVVRRNDAEVPLTVVLGRWDPPQEAPGVTRVCRPLGTDPGRG